MKYLFFYVFVLLFIISSHALYGAVITVSNSNDSGSGSLRDALQTANDGDTIRSNAGIGTIILSSKLPMISKNITIETATGATPQEINANSHGAFVIERGKSVTIRNYNISNGHALGGKGGDARRFCCAGGAGGGGLGAGGAVFVAENAFLTLDGTNVLSNNSAEGGQGGAPVSFFIRGGAGGSGGGGGSFNNVNPNGLEPNSIQGANGGGDNGGIGGFSPSAGGFGGGGGGSSTSDLSINGGDGGFGGGGAGSGDGWTSTIPTGDGGTGGFGGGGGGAGQTGGSGGNGGLYGGSGQTPSFASQGAGGGGAGLGGAVFIQDKGHLTIKNGLLFNMNEVVAGSGFNDGEAHGQDIFMMSGSTLTFDLSDDSIITSDIKSDEGGAGGSGGGIVKTGSATLTLAGANIYTGTTNVQQGTFEVNGSIISPTTVFPLGILKGTGSVKSVQNNGIVVPGSSLTVDGDYTQDPAGFLLININDDPLSSDLLSVSGTAYLDGTVALNPLPGMYEVGMTFTFLQANAINGQFSRILETHPLDFAFNYLTDAVQIVVLAQQPVFPILINLLNVHERRIFDYIFPATLSPSLALICNTLLRVAPSEFSKALLQLGPRQFGGLALSSLQNHVRISQSMNRVGEAFNQFYFSDCYSRSNDRFTWLNPMGYYYKQNKMQEQTPFSDKTYGVTAGYGTTFFDHLFIGSGIGYSRSDINWEDNQGDATIHSIFLSPSVGYIGRHVYAGLVVTGSRSFYDVKRNIRFSTFKDSAHNNHKSYNLLTGLEIGAYIKVPESVQKKIYFFVMAGLDCMNIFERGYQESGAGPINLSVKNKHTSFLHPKALIKLLKEMKNDSLCALPNVYIGWSNNIPLTNGMYESRFYKQQTCQRGFRSKSYHKITNRMLLGAELKTVHKTHFESTIKYEASFGNHYNVQEVKLDLIRRF